MLRVRRCQGSPGWGWGGCREVTEGKKKIIIKKSAGVWGSTEDIWGSTVDWGRAATRAKSVSMGRELGCHR